MFGKKKEEDVKTEEVVEEKVEQEKPDEKVEEKATEPKDEKKPEETVEETAETVEENPTVEDTQPSGNGVRVEDLVTKEELSERLAAFESKYEAVLKENADLKEEVAKIRSKYEEGDFGGEQKQGLSDDNEAANETFESYSRKFMK